MAVKFLKQGFKEQNIKPDFEIEEVVEKIDGIPGYLVLFGMKYSEMKNKDKALESVYKIMKFFIKVPEKWKC